jgi:hypothetical protein
MCRGFVGQNREKKILNFIQQKIASFTPFCPMNPALAFSHRASIKNEEKTQVFCNFTNIKNKKDN